MTREEAREALSVLKIYDAQWLREAVDMAIEALSADALQGEWIDDKPILHSPFAKQYRCSKCGARRYKDNYCSNCGAMMIGGDTE